MNLGWEKHKYDKQVKNSAISFTSKLQQPDLTKQALYQTNPLSDKEHNDLANSRANINRVGLHIKKEQISFKGEWTDNNEETNHSFNLIKSLLKDENDLVREQAINAFEKICKPEHVEIIKPLLNDENLNIRTSAAYCIGKIGKPEHVELLIPFLLNVDSWNCDDHESKDGDTVACAIGKIGKPEHIELLTPLLKDNKSLVVESAAYAIGNIAIKNNMPQLIKSMLSDENQRIRGGAIRAIGNIGKLNQVLFNYRGDVASAIVNIAIKNNTPQLIKPLLLDENEDTHYDTIRAIGKIGRPEHIALLTPLFNYNDDEHDGRRVLTNKAIDEISIKNNKLERIKSLLSTGEIYQRTDTLEAIAKIGKPEHIALLTPLLKDKEFNVRMAAVKAIGKIGKPEHVELIKPFLELKDGWFQNHYWDVKETEKAIARIKARGVIEKAENLDKLVQKEYVYHPYKCETQEDIQESVSAKIQELGNNADTNIKVGDTLNTDQIPLFKTSRTLELKDNDKAGKIEARDAVLHDNSSVELMQVENSLKLYDKSKVDIVYSDSGNVELNGESQINSLFSKKNVNLTGQGEINNISTAGNEVVLTGPVRIKGTIKFEKNGIVKIKQNEATQTAQIDPKIIKNGSLVYDYGNHKGVFGALIANTVIEKSEPDYKKNLGFYGNFQSLKQSYKNNNNRDLSIKLESLPSKKAELLYDKFLDMNLQTIADPSNSKEFTTHWVVNKKLGDKNLTDFWLKSLGKDIENKKPEEKRDLLNKLTKNEKRMLIEITATEYLKNTMFSEFNKKNNTDLNELDETDNSISSITKELETDKSTGIANLLKDDGFQKLENTKIGNKNLVEFWIDVISGDNASQKYSTPRFKKMRLTQILNNPENVNKIVQATLKEVSKDNNAIVTARKAYKDLIDNEPTFTEQDKILLKDYKESKLFYLVITNKVIDKNDIIELGSSTNDLIKNLVAQRKNVEKNSRANIFNPVNDINNVLSNQNDAEMQQKISYIFDILNTKIQGSDQGINTKKKLEKFNSEVEQGSGSAGNTWSELVKEAQQYFETSLLNQLTTKNIKLLYSMNNELSSTKDSEILGFINDPTLDKIEHKEFISRYKDDPNMITMLKNSGVNKKEAVDGLLYLETINKQTFKAQSKLFRDNISLESVRTYEELANKYLSVLGKDYSFMSTQQKTDFLSSVPNEELKLAARTVYKTWEHDDLSKFMSERFVDVEKERNINAQAGSIVNELKKTNKSLDEMKININGQSCTLEQLSNNFSKFADMYQVTQEAQYNELCNMAKQLTSINKNTMKIEANTKALVYKAIKDIDPKLRNEITKLLPEEDRVDISTFLEKVDKLAKEEKDEKRKKQLMLIGAAVATVVVIGAAIYFAPVIVAACSTGGVAGTAATATASHTAATTAAAHVVNSATVAHAGGTASLMGVVHHQIAFGLTKTMQWWKDWLAASPSKVLQSLSKSVTDRTSIATIINAITKEGYTAPTCTV